MDQLTKNKEPDPLISIEVSSARSSASNRSDISGGALSPDFAFSPFSHGYYSPSPSYRTRSRQSSGSNASSSVSNPRRISLAAGERATSYQYYAKSNSLSSHSSPFGDANHHGRYSVDGKMKAFRGMKLSLLRPIFIVTRYPLGMIEIHKIFICPTYFLDEQERVQKKTFVNWINSYLSKVSSIYII